MSVGYWVVIYQHPKKGEVVKRYDFIEDVFGLLCEIEDTEPQGLWGLHLVEVFYSEYAFRPKDILNDKVKYNHKTERYEST